MSDADKELTICRRTLTELTRAKQSELLEIRLFDTLDPALAVQDELGHLIPHVQLQQIYKEK
jgi:hypothetical protein